MYIYISINHMLERERGGMWSHHCGPNSICWYVETIELHLDQMTWPSGTGHPGYVQQDFQLGLNHLELSPKKGVMNRIQGGVEAWGNDDDNDDSIANACHD